MHVRFSPEEKSWAGNPSQAFAFPFPGSLLGLLDFLMLHKRCGIRVVLRTFADIHHQKEDRAKKKSTHIYLQNLQSLISQRDERVSHILVKERYQRKRFKQYLFSQLKSIQLNNKVKHLLLQA